MKNKAIILISILCATASAAFGYAPAGNSMSIGDIGLNLFGAEMGIHEFIQAVCVTSGIALILAALLKFKKYRHNPIATRLSTIIFDLVLGLLLIALSFIPFQL